MVGEDRRRHAAALHLHRRQDGDRHGQRTTPEAGEVVDDRRLALMVVLAREFHARAVL